LTVQLVKTEMTESKIFPETVFAIICTAPPRSPWSGPLSQSQRC